MIKFDVESWGGTEETVGFVRMGEKAVKLWGVRLDPDEEGRE